MMGVVGGKSAQTRAQVYKMHHNSIQINRNTFYDDQADQFEVLEAMNSTNKSKNTWVELPSPRPHG